MDLTIQCERRRAAVWPVYTVKIESSSIEHDRSSVARSEAADARALIAAVSTTRDPFPVSGIRKMIEGGANTSIANDDYFGRRRTSHRGRRTLRRARIEACCDRNRRDRNRATSKHELCAVLLLQILNNGRENDVEISIPLGPNIGIGIELLHDGNVDRP